MTKTKEKVRRGRARSHGKCKGIEFAYVLGRSCTILVPSFVLLLLLQLVLEHFVFISSKTSSSFGTPSPPKKD